MRIPSFLSAIAALSLGVASAQTPPPVPPDDPSAVAVLLPPAAPAKWQTMDVTLGRINTISFGTGKYRWELIDEQNADLVPSADGSSASFTASVAGTYRVIAYSGLRAAARLKLIVTAATPVPVPPGPTPPVPNPIPVPPAPVAGTGVGIVVVANDAGPTIAEGKILDGPSLRALKAAGKCRVYGAITEADKLKALGYDKALVDFKLIPPCLLIFDGSTPPKVVYSGPLPMDETTLAAKLKEVMK